MAIPRGQFNWVELVTTDAKAALDFYSHVMGWTSDVMPGAGGRPYHVLSASGAGLGGVYEVTQQENEGGMKTGWVGYLTTPDVDGDAERISRAGGKIFRKAEDIPNVGRLVPAADPQGAGFMLMHPKPPPGVEPKIAKGIGAVGWAELTTSDAKAAWAFYSEIFGWKAGELLKMGATEYQLFTTGADPGGGMFKPLELKDGPQWLYYFIVDGLNSAMRRVTDKGGRVLDEPMQVPGGAWVVTARDSLGGLFALTAETR